jgi:hypothetical protein
MNIKRRVPTLLLLLVSSLALTSNSCGLLIQDGAICTAAGRLSAGADCGHLISAKTQALTFKEAIDMLEAQPKRTCVPIEGMEVCKEDQSTGTPTELPARGAGVFLSALTFTSLKTELEILCRQRKSKCSYAIIHAFKLPEPVLP